MKPNFTNAFFQTRCLRTVLRRAVVCMLLLGTTVVHAQERKITVDTRQEVTLVQFFRQVEPPATICSITRTRMWRTSVFR